MGRAIAADENDHRPKALVDLVSARPLIRAANPSLPAAEPYNTARRPATQEGHDRAPRGAASRYWLMRAAIGYWHWILLARNWASTGPHEGVVPVI